MIRNALFLILALIMMFIWFAGWALMHMAGGAIHLILVLAVIFFVLHFFRGRRAV